MAKSFFSLLALVIFFFSLYQLQQHYLNSKNFYSLPLNSTASSPLLNNQGHLSLYYFGYTNCPDICPTALMTLSQALKDLPDSITKSSDFENLKIYFITLDPDRDSAEQMLKYASFFHPKIQGLQLDKTSLNQLVQFFGVQYKYVKNAKESSAMGYSVDHSSIMYIVAPNGNVQAVIPHEATSEVITQTLKSVFTKKENL